MILTGAGQIGMAIARRMGFGMKIVIGDKKPENAKKVAYILNNAGFDAVFQETDLSSRTSIKSLIATAQDLEKSKCWSMLPAFRKAKHQSKPF